MNESRLDFVQNGQRVVQEATGQRPKTKPPEDGEHPEAIRCDKADRRVAG